MQNKKLILFPFALVLFEVASYLSNDMYLPALPTIAKELAVSNAQAQNTITWWFIGAVSLQLFLGPISDRFGRRPIIFAGGILFIITSIICALTSNYDLFVIARFLEGTSVCFVTVVGYASIHESFDQIQAIKVFAIMGSITLIAPAFGPLFGSIVLLVLNWRWIFVCLVLLTLISMVALYYLMPETLPVSERHKLEMNLTLKRYWSIFTNKRFLNYSILLGFIFCGFITWIVAGPFLVIERFHYQPYMFGVYQAIIFTFYIVVNNSVKYLIDRLGVHKVIRTGIVIAFIGSVIIFVFAWLLPEFLEGMVIGYVIFAIGSALEFAPLNRMAVESSNEPMGARMAVFSSLFMAYASLGSVLVSVFYNGTLISLASIVLIVMMFGLLLEFTR